jgi:hypothetical protein
MNAIKKTARFLGEIAIAAVAAVLVIAGGFLLADRAWNHYLDTHCVSGFGTSSGGCVNDSQSR